MIKIIDQNTFEILTAGIIEKLSKQLKKTVRAYSSLRTHEVIITTI
jgi:hypothetical protein